MLCGYCDWDEGTREVSLLVRKQSGWKESGSNGGQEGSGQQAGRT